MIALALVAGAIGALLAALGVSVFLLVVVIVSEKLSDRIAAWIRG